MIKKLAAIANELDADGSIELADRIDSVIDEIQKKTAGSAPQKKPVWFEAVQEALPLLDQALAVFNKHMASDANLEYAVKEMRRILNENKPK